MIRDNKKAIRSGIGINSDAAFYFICVSAYSISDFSFETENI